MNKLEKSFAELERIEDKYIIKKEDFEAIKAELEKNMDPAYPSADTTYVLISTTYLDSLDREFYRSHLYDLQERIKVRYRKYGPNGKWNNKDVFLEVKEKVDDDVKKTRIQLDQTNLDKVNRGSTLVFTKDLETLNEPLYTHTDLKRFIEKYNKIALKSKMRPVITINYRRIAYGRGSLRVTMDTDLTFKPVDALSLTQASNLKRAVDWGTAKEYAKKYTKNENAVLEIKHETNRLPTWLKDLIAKYELKPERFSKYIWATSNNIKGTLLD